MMLIAIIIYINKLRANYYTQPKKFLSWKNIKKMNLYILLS